MCRAAATRLREHDPRVANEPILAGEAIGTVNSESDSELIARSLDEPHLFGELFVRYAQVIQSYAARRLGIHAAEDVLSDTFLVAFQKRARFDLARPDARPWLYGIATNLIKHHRHDEIRAMSALRSVEHDVDPPDMSGRVGQRVDAERQLRELGDALRHMASRDRDALLLFAWGDLSYEEIGQAMNIPVGTVRSRLNRARRLLAAAKGQTTSSAVEVNDGPVGTSS